MSLKETIIGNEKVADMLEKSYRLNRLSHAYLFEGPEHIGKRTLALNFCKLVLDDPREDIKKNPDLIIVSPLPDEKQIKVERIRELEKSLSLYPYSAKYKIALIEEAEKMNKSAANALLKTLEEPNKTTIIILLSSSSKNILETIRSRCQILKFLPVKKKALEKALEAKSFNKSEIEEIIELSARKPGKAMELSENLQQIKKAKENTDLLLKIFKEKENERIDEAETISKKETNEIILMLDFWIIYLRKALLSEYNGGHARKINLLKIKSGLKSINTAKQDLLERNINVRLAVENLLLSI